MTRLEELIQTLCPDGVEFKKLGQICNITTGKLNANAMKDGGKYPFFTCAKEVYQIDKYAFDTEALLISGNGSQVGHIHHYKGKFNAYQRTYVLDNFSENISYISHVLKAFLKQRILEEVNISGVPYIKLDTLSEFLIPIPPLPVQEEIVRILDTFTALETELEAELAARTKQYEYYRNELLSFDSKSKIIEKLFVNSCVRKVEFLSINEVLTTITPPKKLIRDQYKESGTIPIIDQGQNPIVGYTDDLDASLPKNSYVLFGDHTRKIKFVDYPFAQGADGLKILISRNDKYLTKYLYYALQNADIVSHGYSRHWSYAKKVCIPIPPLEVQEKIVSILDRFEALVNDLKSGLPAEIALRRKQYEYYRDKLLSF